MTKQVRITQNMKIKFSDSNQVFLLNVTFVNLIVSNGERKGLYMYCTYFECLQIPINEKLLHEFHCYVLHTQKKIHVYNSSQDSQCDKFANCLAKSINDDRSALFGKVFTNN